MTIEPAFTDARVEARFAGFVEPARSGLLALRCLIYATAAEMPGVGALQETLKWRQPAYLTPDTKSGSTLRLDATSDGLAIYVNCQTTILADFQSLYPTGFRYEGNRAVHFVAGAELPLARLRFLIARALTYHLPRPG